MSIITLTYHSISTRRGGGSEQEYVLPPHIFQMHLRLLEAFRIPVLPIEAVLADRRGRGVVLTFDDAYEDFATVAWPMLRERGFPATVMVPTEHIGGLDVWAQKLPTRRRIMDWPTLKALVREGAQIGSHSATHCDLRTLPIAQADWELRCSRERLRAELGIPCDTLAYPFNHAVPELMRIAERVGYQAAFGGSRADDSRFNRRRMDVSGAGLLWFAAQVFGWVNTGRRLKQLALRRILSRYSSARRSVTHPSSVVNAVDEHDIPMITSGGGVWRA